MKYPANPIESLTTLLDAARVLAGNAGLHDIARDCASLTVKAIRQDEAQTKRPELTFDRFGVTGPDGERIATFCAATESNDPAKTYGPLFASSPDMLAALIDAEQALNMTRYVLQQAGHASNLIALDYAANKAKSAIEQARKA